ncbi:ORF6N domain-containing protein [uncultured Alistipes sp.]|uniref:ORF6N domain-containing protein n=1 Tax=uncultured Alistipes sp. TaxID=538949 RepID=UPI00266FC99D|nr:ORF6N domain-containing protein [uncultured Alistipes sp.]
MFFALSTQKARKIKQKASSEKLSYLCIRQRKLQPIQNKIYEIRGQRVMLDFDLAAMYRVETAIQVNIAVMRAFVAIRQVLTIPPADQIGRLETQMQELKKYIEEIFADQNDINEDTRMQLELINQTLAELQSRERPSIRNRRPIGFIRK